MTTYFTADQHFSHGNIIDFCNRPFDSVHEMNKALTEQWNNTVNRHDTVYFLGDFSMKEKEDFHRQLLSNLNGRIIWIVGNHDKKAYKKWLPRFKEEGLIEDFDQYREVSINGKFIVLFHYPLLSWNKRNYKAYHLFGHVHGMIPSYGKAIDVGVDNHEITSEYRPVSWEEVEQFFKEKPLEHVE